MNTEAQRARSLFLTLVENHPREGWSAYLDEVCAGDADLRSRVEMLLQAHLDHNSLLDDPLPGILTTLAEPIVESPGALIDHYKLLEQIGEGGFGVVFMAEQTEPVRRRVALKILKPGMDSKQVIIRFEAERQALAMMDHPNIARVLDTGATQSGRPYMVMELVKGVPVTDYCDQNNLTVRERLHLFVNICQAVQHAHQKGIIHRDIKPSNVLVTLHDGTPVVKVIDFGIAKAMTGHLTDKTLFTGFAQMIGTPLYMSPEQAGMSALDVDTRSDIYSLGVLLYELLTGTTPFNREQLKEVGFDEIRRIIREEEPPKPSTRISTLGQAATTVSAQRQSEPKRLSQLLRGELDWIVMRALEKDRSQRYETANALALDVQRYLNDEPVQACPPSTAYRLRKFVRRNKGALTVAAAMLALLLAGTAVSTWQAVRATRAEQKTSEALAQVTAAQDETREALDALTNDVVETLFARQPELEDKEKVFLRKVLGFYEKATQQSGSTTADARFLKAKGYFKVARLRGLFGEQQEAAAGYRQAAQLLEQLVRESPHTAEYRHKLARTNGNLGILLAESGKDEEAEKAIRRALELRIKLVEQFPTIRSYQDELARNYNDLGFFHDLQQKYKEAETAYKQALELEEKLVAESGGLAPYRQSLARIQSALGGLLRKRNEFTAAHKLLKQAITTQEEVLKESPLPKSRRQLADTYQQMGILLAEMKRGEEAETAFRQSADLRKKLSDEFPKVLQYRRELARTNHDMGFLLWRERKYAESEAAYHEALKTEKKLVADHDEIPAYHQDLARTYVGLGHAHRDQNNPEAAEKFYQKALLHQRKLAITFSKITVYRNELVDTLVNVALLHRQRRDFAAAAPLLEEAHSHLRAALDINPNHKTSRRYYHDIFRIMAQTYMGLADHARLAKLADDLAAYAYDPINDAYNGACMLCRSAALADKDNRLDNARRKALTQRYSDRALALLGQAVACGFKDGTQMKMDPDFEPLRARQEFRNLLAQLEAKKKK